MNIFKIVGVATVAYVAHSLMKRNSTDASFSYQDVGLASITETMRDRLTELSSDKKKLFKIGGILLLLWLFFSHDNY